MNLLRLNPWKNPPTRKRTEPVVGWRGWDINDKGELLSLMHSVSWPGRKALWAYNLRAMDNGPAPTSPSGIHAFKLQGDALAYIQYHRYDPNRRPCYGSVYLWGKVFEHRNGYRAEYAYPKQLFMPRDSDPLLIMQVEDRYGVTVTELEEWQRQQARNEPHSLYLALAQQMAGIGGMARMAGNAFGQVLPRTATRVMLQNTDAQQRLALFQLQTTVQSPFILQSVDKTI